MADNKVFSLEGRGLKLDTAADVEPHIKPLVDNNDVEEVRLLGNTLGVGACEAIAKVLETKKQLQVANLADIFTGRLLNEIPQALDALLKALLTLPSLHTVNLNDNAFGLNTQAPLVSFLSAHAPLQHLILNNNGLGPAAGTLIAEALVKLAEKKAEARKAGTEVPNLETVICGRNRLENGSMAAWAKAYAAHNGVKEIKMVQNGIRQEGITLLIKEGLRYLTGLQILDLQDNTFTAKGARALADVVCGWTDLVELGVGDCLLSARGGVYLAEALMKGQNKKIQVLRLQYNEFKASTVKGIADADAKGKLPNLQRVELNGNILSEEDESIDRLRESLTSRRESATGETNDEDWGLDELDELEEEDEDDEDGDEVEEDDDEDDDDVTADQKGEAALKQADEAEDEPTAQEKSKEIDDLADQLGKTEIK